MTAQTNNKDAVRLRQLLHSSTAAVAILIGGMTGASWADESLDSSLNGLAPVSAEELSNNRGGFSVGPVNISFGFTMATSMSGGALGAGVTITQNFTVNSGGGLAANTPTVTANPDHSGASSNSSADLSSLGQTIGDEVQQNLQQAGIGNLATKITNAVNSALANSIPAATSALASNNGTNPSPSVDAAAATATTALNQAATSTGATEGATPSVQTPDTSQQIASVASFIPSPPTPSGQSAGTPSISPSVTASNVQSGTPPTSGTNLIGGQTSTNGQSGNASANGPSANGLPSNIPFAPPPPDPSSLPVSASVDPKTGNLLLAFGGTSFLVNNHGISVQNTANDVKFSNVLIANFSIDNYHDIASLASMHQQISDIAQQMLAIQGIIGRH